ncbi:MAG: hypothetical protein ACYC4B_20225, partial [Pirellulaceae bacterium]
GSILSTVARSLRPGKHHIVVVPEGRSIIAQRFIAGFWFDEHALESRRGDRKAEARNAVAAWWKEVAL